MIEFNIESKTLNLSGLKSTITRSLILAGVFSSVVNLFSLASPLFMLEIYDRVIPSNSEATLAVLTGLVVAIYCISGFLEVIRGRVMSRIAGLIDDDMSERVITAIASARLRMPTGADVLKPAQDAELVRSFLSGPAAAALFDLLWLPFYLAICFVLHPAIGSLASLALAILVTLSFAAALSTRKKASLASASLATRNRFGEAVHRNAESISAMGILPQIRTRWKEQHRHHAETQLELADWTGLFSGLFKTTRQMVQSGSLALGAWLVLEGEMTGGTIVAASIIVARTLQPLELLIGNWRSLVAAQQSWKRLQELFKSFPDKQNPDRQNKVSLPEPTQTLRVERLSASPPGDPYRMIVNNVSFHATAGTALGIVGPSGSGKTSLAKTLSGVWTTSHGEVRLDDAPLDQWPMHMLGRHIGYMPQSSDLLPGTIGENIARLDRAAADRGIISAAHAAGAHEMIVSLPDGYQTTITDGGSNLSAGQRQRVALARALYGDPFLVILDEPNSNLDRAGDEALVGAIRGVKARGGIAVVVTHRDSILSQLDTLLVMKNGTATAFGPREIVLQSIKNAADSSVRLQRPPLQPVPPLVEHG